MSSYIGIKGTEPGGPGKNSTGPGDLMNAGLYIEFTHVPTGHLVRLPAAISSFDDMFTVNTSSESVYGRMDELVVYKNTIREIKTRLQLIPVDRSDAVELLAAVGMLQKFLYPQYGTAKVQGDNSVSVSTIASPPLIRTKLANLISHPDGKQGLLGFMKQYSLAPSDDAGFFTLPKGNTGEVLILPKQYEMDFTFSVLHEHDVGWNREGKFLGGDTYPHGISTSAPSLPGKPTPPPPPKPEPPRTKEEIRKANEAAVLAPKGMINPSRIQQ